MQSAGRRGGCCYEDRVLPSVVISINKRLPRLSIQSLRAKKMTSMQACHDCGWWRKRWKRCRWWWWRRGEYVSWRVTVPTREKRRSSFIATLYAEISNWKVNTLLDIIWECIEFIEFFEFIEYETSAMNSISSCYYLVNAKFCINVALFSAPECSLSWKWVSGCLVETLTQLLVPILRLTFKWEFIEWDTSAA